MDDDRSQTSAPLTAKQVRTLETALEMGYFETPREVTLKDLAAELGCSHQALSEVLRRATKQLTTAALNSQTETEPLWVCQSQTDASRVHKHPNCPELTSSVPKQIAEETAEWHDLEPCPRCSGTVSFGFAPKGVTGAD